LSQGQKSALAQSSGEGSLPGKVAANLLAGQISQVLGEKLNLDVIEVEAAGNLQSAVVEVGKYITSDIFISYKHSFGSASDNDLEPAIVTMEYQIMRFLFLQLTGGDAEDAGFDFIVKLQKR
jgi:autotransporter translocation and assembly factor TamB